jgi:hypothetical protein
MTRQAGKVVPSFGESAPKAAGHYPDSSFRSMLLWTTYAFANHTLFKSARQQDSHLATKKHKARKTFVTIVLDACCCQTTRCVRHCIQLTHATFTSHTRHECSTAPMPPSSATQDSKTYKTDTNLLYPAPAVFHILCIHNLLLYKNDTNAALHQCHLHQSHKTARHTRPTLMQHLGRGALRQGDNLLPESTGLRG